MALKVQFTFTDAEGRATNRTWTTTSSTIADALTDAQTLATALEAAFDAGLSGVSISLKDGAADYAPVALSNIDEGATFGVTGDDGFKYSIKIPIPKAAIRAGGGAIILGDALTLAVTDQFLTAGKWRVNNRTPTFVATVDTGKLDK